VNRARGSTTSGSFGGLLRQPPTVWETGRTLAEKGGIILRIDTVIGDSLGERSRASAEKGVVVGSTRCEWPGIASALGTPTVTRLASA